MKHIGFPTGGVHGTEATHRGGFRLKANPALAALQTNNWRRHEAPPPLSKLCADRRPEKDKVPAGCRAGARDGSAANGNARSEASRPTIFAASGRG